MKDQLTIIIPCKNEGKIIERCLKLLYKSEQINGVRIIVADDSTDNGKTIEILRNFPIEIIKGGLPSIARNNGAKLSNTPYILFLDADMFLENPGTLKKILTHAKNKQLDLITCKVRTDTGKYNWVYKSFDMVQFMTKFHKPFALGGFMLFKSEKFFELGMFDENSKVAEDYQLSMKVKPNKFDISQEKVYTTPRRFDNKGIYYMVKLMLKTWWGNKQNKTFQNDYGYWDKTL